MIFFQDYLMFRPERLISMISGHVFRSGLHIIRSGHDIFLRVKIRPLKSNFEMIGFLFRILSIGLYMFYTFKGR